MSDAAVPERRAVLAGKRAVGRKLGLQQPLGQWHVVEGQGSKARRGHDTGTAREHPASDRRKQMHTGGLCGCETSVACRSFAGQL